MLLKLATDDFELSLFPLPGDVIVESIEGVDAAGTKVLTEGLVVSVVKLGGNLCASVDPC